VQPLPPIDALEHQVWFQFIGDFLDKKCGVSIRVSYHFEVGSR
jgi:hypothetical protein